MAILAQDQITIADVTDGYSVYLEKYAHIFDGNKTNALAGSTTCKVTALLGPDVVACSVDVAAIVKPAGITVTKDSNSLTPTLTITASTAFNAPGFLSIPVLIVDAGVTIIQTMALSFAKTGIDGTPGVSATIMGLKNEAQMIPCDSAGKVLTATTVQVDTYAAVGANRAAVSAVVSGLASGITVGTNTAGTTSADGILTLVFAKDSTLGGTDVGNVAVALTANGQTRNAVFSWSKSKAGVDGKDSIVMDVVSSNGLIFKNTAVTTVLTANVYKGGVPVTGATLTALGTIKWYKDGTLMSGVTGSTLSVSAADVLDKATFLASLES